MNGQPRTQAGGMWNTQRPVISNETQNLLKAMMKESKLTNFQQRTLSSTMQSGRSLPPRVAPDHTIVQKKVPQPKAMSKRVDPRSDWNGIRKLDDIVTSGAYEKSDYKPTPQRAITDQDKEHLGKIMAYGKDQVNWPKQRPVIDYDDLEEPEEIDRFEELKAEVNERVDFLESMAAVGKRKQYQTIIMTEISQKIREMELLDKSRTAELEELIKRKKNT